MTDEQLKLEAESIFYSQDPREAIQLSRRLKSEYALTDYAKTLLPKLQYIRMASLSEDDLIQLLKDNLSAAYGIPDFDLAEKIRWYIDQKSLPPYQVSVAEKIKSLLESHQAHIGQSEIMVKSKKSPSTIGNWIMDYNSYPAREGGHDALSQIEYTNKSANIKNLKANEINVLKNILRLYDYVCKIIIDWDAVPTPKTEAEAFKDYDLYQFIPGLDLEDDEPESTSPQPEAATTPPVIKYEEPVVTAPAQAPANPVQQAAPQPVTSVSSQPKPQQPTEEQLRTIEGIRLAKRIPGQYKDSNPATSGPLTSADSAKIHDLINKSSAANPASKRGVTMDPTNIKIDEEQKRLDSERNKKSLEIQKKLSELRTRNNNPK